jgi:tyrosine-protein kinase
VKAGTDGRGGSSLRDYLSVARRRKWIILQAVILLPLAAALYSSSHSPTYRATARVLLSRQNLATQLSGMQDPNQYQQDQTLVQTQANLARIPAIAQRAILTLNDHTMTPADFLASSSVGNSVNTDILAFNFDSGDSTFAAKAATAYAQSYAQYRRGLDTASIESARREVSNRVQQLVAQGDGSGALYASLVEREQQLRTMEALQTSNASVVQTANSGQKIGPRPTHAALIGLFLGILLGIGLAFLREALDTRVRSAEEIAERLHIPLLARLPAPPKRLRTEDRLTMLEEPTGTDAEAFRLLRTNLEFSMLGKDVKSIVISSALAQEGKSTTVANLAIALARGGQRVVLVDLDLRRPYLEKFFDIYDRPGVTQVVLGRASLDEALYRVEIERARPSARLRPRYDFSELNGRGDSVLGSLSVLGAGPIPPDPGEFVASGALSEVLAELRQDADVVLVDAPPMLHVGDAMALSSKVDALMLVTRMEKVRRPMLSELKRMIDSAPTRKLGFIVTGAEAEEGYGYGYGYGYDYTRAYEPEPLRAEKGA